MVNRNELFKDQVYDTPYPQGDDKIFKECDICGTRLQVNNWPDGKSRTAIFKGFVVCGYCDPRPISDHYNKKGYRIMFPKRLRVIRLAQVTRALARYGCLKSPDEQLPDCKCAGCAAKRLFPNG